MEHSRNKIPNKILIYSTLFYLVIFLVFLGLYFLNFISLSWSLGWLLGAIVASFNYASIIFQATRLKARIEAKITTPYRSSGYAFARLVISASGMLACVLIEVNNQEVFNLFTLFAAYLVIAGIIFITGSQFQPMRKTT
jgi:drug/metabolite transporter (DMT)-like permease